MILGAAPFRWFYKRTYYNEYGYPLSPKHIKSPLGRYFFKAQGGMRAKPDMNPWVSTDKSKMSSFRSSTNSERLVCSFAFVGKGPPLRGSINKLGTNNPGLAPWAMQEYRPYRAHLRPSNQHTLLFWCACSSHALSAPRFDKWCNLLIFELEILHNILTT